jgi:hypothetical protein
MYKKITRKQIKTLKKFVLGIAPECFIFAALKTAG